MIINKRPISLDEKAEQHGFVSTRVYIAGMLTREYSNSKTGETFTTEEFKKKLKELEKATTSSSNSDTNSKLKPIKRVLDGFKYDFLFNLKILAHKSNSRIKVKKTNYNLEDEMIYVESNLVSSLKDYQKELLTQFSKQNFNESNEPINNFKNTLKHKYPNFNINYKDKAKKHISSILSDIPQSKLETLKIYKLDENKKDQYDKLVKTNYQRRLNILYYLENDLKHIQFFLKETTTGFAVKNLHQKYSSIKTA